MINLQQQTMDECSPTTTITTSTTQNKTSQSNVLAWNWTTTYSVVCIWHGIHRRVSCLQLKAIFSEKKHEFERKGNVKYRARLSNVFNCSIFAVGSFQTTSHTCVLCFMLVVCCTLYNVYILQHPVPSQLLFWWLICCALLLGGSSFFIFYWE